MGLQISIENVMMNHYTNNILGDFEPTAPSSAIKKWLYKRGTI
jgi:hypothetical protein